MNNNFNQWIYGFSMNKSLNYNILSIIFYIWVIVGKIQLMELSHDLFFDKSVNLTLIL
jgi:hypothetical protein